MGEPDWIEILLGAWDAQREVWRQWREMNNLSRELFLTGLGEDPIYLASVSPMLEAISKMMSFKSTLYSLKANFDKSVCTSLHGFVTLGWLEELSPRTFCTFYLNKEKK